jgi:hypothetical protein
MLAYNTPGREQASTGIRLQLVVAAMSCAVHYLNN